MYTLELANTDGTWGFVAEYEEYGDAMREISGWTYVTGRIRRGNELIYRNFYPKEELDLADWRRRHIG